MNYELVFFMRNFVFSFAFIISISIKINSKSIEHLVIFLKLVLRNLKTVLKNKKNLKPC